MRLFIIAIISLASLFPLLMFSTEVCGLSDDSGGIVSIVLGWVVLPALLLKFWQGLPDPSAIPVDIDDPIMQEQIQRARSELPRFIEGLHNGNLEAFIKFPYEFEGEVEHVWGVAHSYGGGQFIVSLASEPVGEASNELHSRVKVAENELEDWTLTDAKGNTQGGYTMLAMARLYAKNYGKLPKMYCNDLERFVDFKWPENA